MKSRILTVTFIFCLGLMASTAVAQQDPGDQGVADSVFILITPQVDTVDGAQISAELYFFNDAQNVTAASMGFSWSSPNMVLDSAVMPPEAISCFNFFRLLYYRNSLDSSNANQRFQFAGSRLAGDGLPASDSPRLIATYYFHLTDTIPGDTICINRGDFYDFLFVDLDIYEYSPIWRGDVCIGTPEPPEPPGTPVRVLVNPANGHTYELWQTSGAISWHEAKSEAEHRGGYLVTITDSIEADIVRRLLPFLDEEAWLGGSDEELEGVWTWVTGEPWLFTNWLPGEPDSTYPNEDYLFTQGLFSGRWIDAADPQHGYIVEYEPTHNDSLLNLVQWPMSEGGNNNWYALLAIPMNWPEAHRRASSLNFYDVQGHLATVTSIEENQFILQNVLEGAWPDSLSIVLSTEYWLGAMAYGDFEWVTGEPFDFTNWADGHPFDTDTLDVIAMVGYGWDVNPPFPGQWVSRSPHCGLPDYWCRWAVVEFDRGPIVAPRVLRVPEEFPTIMAAIDSARHGDEVIVGPGTYFEAINFLGKNIRVHSSHGPQNTIITNDRTVDLVTFDRGESRAAVLEGFTLQGGWMAVVCDGSYPTIKRNVCVEQNVWNWAAIGLIGELIRLTEANGDPKYTGSVGPAGAALINNTIVYGANGGISSFSSEPPLILNNIVAFNQNYGIHQQNPTGQPQPDISYNDVFANGSGIWPTVDYINIPDPGPGAISLDPQFDRSFGLLPGSPCIDAGDPNPRFNDPDSSRNDMGAVFRIHEPGGGVTPTNEWIIVYCSGLAFPMPPFPPDRLLQAYDPGGALCGETWIRGDESFGFMPIYRDDADTDFDEGALPGDLITFHIDGNPVSSDPQVYWTANGDIIEVCSFGQETCLEFQLHAGWNLISWNVAYEGDIRETFQSILPLTDVVLSFEGDGLVFDTRLPEFSTLDYVDYHHAYWVRVLDEMTLTICGPPIPPYEVIALEAGWNLGAYWPDSPMEPYDALITVQHIMLQVMGFDRGAQIWLPGMDEFNTLKYMAPGFGYWVKVAAPGYLDYPPFGGMDSIKARPEIPSGSASTLPETSREWISVYGSDITIDGLPLADDAVLEFSSTDGIVCGRGQYTGGLLKMVPVYGRDDTGELAKSYPKAGDQVAIMINGQPVYPSLTWEGNGERIRLSHLTSDAAGLPETFVLKQNYPNPFNPETRIEFAVPKGGAVKIAVYNALGQRVKVLTDRDYAPGRYEVQWDGTDSGGDRVATGIYFYRLTAGEETRTRKMMLLK